MAPVKSFFAIVVRPRATSAKRLRRGLSSVRIKQVLLACRDFQSEGMPEVTKFAGA
jgi:hypothetical protein